MLSSTATGESFAFPGHGLSLLRGKPPLQSLQTRADPPGIFGFSFGFSFRYFHIKQTTNVPIFRNVRHFGLLSQPLSFAYLLFFSSLEIIPCSLARRSAIFGAPHKSGNKISDTGTAAITTND